MVIQISDKDLDESDIEFSKIKFEQEESVYEVILEIHRWFYIRIGDIDEIIENDEVKRKIEEVCIFC